MVRRVGTDVVSVWVALRAPVVGVRLSIYRHHSDATDALASEVSDPVRIGANLYFVLATVRSPAGARLEAGTIYAYDLDFITDGGSHQNLGALGLLSNTTIDGHRHLALGYDEGVLPTFVTPARDAIDLAFAHGSCRRAYAQGLDALVALDSVIEGDREGAARPQYLFLTGDQIYVDDVSNELLQWSNENALELIGKNTAGRSIEQLRVSLPDRAFTRTVRFGADHLHFPPGRRARIGARAAGLTSDDNQNHALSFGEIATYYMMSWCNVLWKPLSDPTTWSALYNARGDLVEDYLTQWLLSNAGARAARANTNGAAAPESLDERTKTIDAWRLVPKAARAIDQFAEPAAAAADWNGDEPSWKKFWATRGIAPPAPDDANLAGGTSGVDKAELRERPADASEETDLADLAHLLTPAWFAGTEAFNVRHDYNVADDDPPKPVHELELFGDSVLSRLDRLRCLYEGLPYARRALANVSTLMMLDDHDVTDDFGATKRWRRELSATALGRDVITNALAAYLLFQDWGNDPDRYTQSTKNRDALDAVKEMFIVGGQPRENGPPEEVRGKLERLFGFKAGDDVPLEEQAVWNYQITDPDVAPYEIIAIDNRTRRGYDTDTSEPADLSFEQIEAQIPASGPSGSAVTIVIAPLPVVGYPPLEEIVQPIAGIVQATRRAPKLRSTDTFPEVEVDYRFGKMFADPEAWAFNSRAQEHLFARLASRASVVLLSGDIHFSMTGKLTYWKRSEGSFGNPSRLVPASRFAQLISSAVRNEKGGMIQELVQLGLAEQLGAVIGGPYDRLGWAEGGVNRPDFDTTGSSHQLITKMRMNPVVIPTRMLNATAKQQLRTRTMQRPPEWAWRFEIVKDTRPEDVRYGAMPSSGAEHGLPSETDLHTDRAAAIQMIANHHAWNAQFGLPRRTFFYSNIALVRFERRDAADPASPLVLVHTLQAWDRTVVGPRGTADFDRPWPTTRTPAQPYAQYRVPLGLDDEIPPDEPDPAEPPS